MIISPWQLRNIGVLGINERNARYIFKYNKRSLYPLADDKTLTKKKAQDCGLSVPELYAVFDSVGGLRYLESRLEGLSEFVIKPAHGAGGEGVLVIAGSAGNVFHRVNGETMDAKALKHHCAHIIHGLYSLGGQADKAMVEYRVRFASIFEDLTVGGVPDVRIIVFLGVPVMAMLRLPTRESSGRANLHQGAVGTGISVASGLTHGGVQGSTRVSHHPDTGVEITGVQIPFWDEMLKISSLCYEMTGLGYLGVDLVVDEVRGPLMLEVNARPGLAVQIANNAPLLPRLKRVESDGQELSTLEGRIAFAKEHFT